MFTSDLLINELKVRGQRYEKVYMAPLLSRLTKEVKKISLPAISIPKLDASAYQNNIANGPTNATVSSKITQSNIWKRIGSFLQPNDVVVADTGTAPFGLADAQFPKNTK